MAKESGHQMEFYPMTQAVGAGYWCLRHMSQVDPSIKYARCFHTDGHNWKLYEVHETHVKKTKFFVPNEDSRRQSGQRMKFTSEPRFFDDFDHMLSVIGLIRYAMGISENIVMKSDSYEVEELPSLLDPTRTIKKTLLSASNERPGLAIDRKIIPEIAFDREKEKALLESKERERAQLGGAEDPRDLQ
mmetsp:Transcript_4490/g.7654  ORF Transcript_4490/g.7654 Transcript_4490/m.7654 type:complete len:188 (+) Transcript_4490:457-1020(+)